MEGKQRVQKTWTLDALGNDLGAGTYSAANEETPNSGSSGYDAAGNMTTLTSGDTAIYDAWNRLVEVDNGSTIVEKCRLRRHEPPHPDIHELHRQHAEHGRRRLLRGQQVVESDVTTAAACKAAINTSGRRGTSTPRSSATR